MLWGRSHLSRTRCCVLWGGLGACWGAGGLGLMHGARVVGEGLWSCSHRHTVSVTALLCFALVEKHPIPKVLIWASGGGSHSP